MIIFGSKWIQKLVARKGSYHCTRCNNVNSFQMIKATQWFTLFFIPIFPIRTDYHFACPICSNSSRLNKKSFHELLEKVD